MERKIESVLKRWRANPNRKALMILGARQVGKTYIVNKFGESYTHYLNIDLSEESFDDGFWTGSAEDILRRITGRYPSFRIEAGESLLFLDEIQDCDGAFSSLKTLTKNGHVDVICSGSFLGIQERAPKRYPVGYVHEVEMHPMDFEEYLWALGFSHEQTSDIKGHMSSATPFDPSMLHILEGYYRQYLIVGGMPLPVLTSIESLNSGDYMEAQDDILNGYERDIMAYAGSARDDALRLLRLIPMELGKPNKRLMFKDIDGRPNTGIREYREPVNWIEGSRLVNACHRLTSIERPLRRNSRDNMFKMYLVDTGLLVRLYGQGTVEAMMRSDLSVNEGAIGENSVCQMLRSCGLRPFYYEVDKEVEVDFIVEIGSEICAVEVKTGKKRRARSMKKLMEMDAGKEISRWIKFEYGNIMKTDDGVEHYPLFMAAFADLLVEPTRVELSKADPDLSFG